jgi:outer membrane protein TolC
MMAETGVTISRLDRQTIENSLIASAIQAYYNSLAARAFIDIAEASVDTVESQLRVMEVRYRAGGALKSDLLSLQVRLAEAQQEVVDRKNQYQKALTALSNIMGISPEPPVRLRQEEALPVKVPKHYLGGVAFALDHRPELKKVRQQLMRSRMNVDRARAGYLPRVDLEGKYYLDDEDLDYDTDRENWTMGVMLNWDIFSGFSTRAQELKAKAALDEMLSADRETALSVQMDVKTAYLDAEAALARLEVARASVAAAEESLDLVKKQYEGGSATITRYLEAELDRNRARTRAAAAFYDRDKAIADIARAVGYWANVFANGSADTR